MGNEEVAEIGIHVYFTSGCVVANLLMASFTLAAIVKKAFCVNNGKEVFFVQRAIAIHVELSYEVFSEKIVSKV